MSDHQTGGTASNHHVIVGQRNVWDPEVRTDQLSSCQAFRIAACRIAKARCPQQLPHEEMPPGLHAWRLWCWYAKGQRLQRDRGRWGKISSKWQRAQVTPVSCSPGAIACVRTAPAVDMRRADMGLSPLSCSCKRSESFTPTWENLVAGRFCLFKQIWTLDSRWPFLGNQAKGAHEKLLRGLHHKRRSRGFRWSLTYYFVCDQPATLFLSHCLALLRRCACGLLSSKTAASSSLMLPLALSLSTTCFEALECFVLASQQFLRQRGNRCRSNACLYLLS